MHRTADVIYLGDVKTPGTGSATRSDGLGQVTIMFFHFFLTLAAMCKCLGCVNQKSFLGSVPFYARLAFDLMISLGEMYALSRVIDLLPYLPEHCHIGE